MQQLAQFDLANISYAEDLSQIAGSAQVRAWRGAKALASLWWL